MLNGFHAITLTHRQLSVEKVGKLVLPENDCRFEVLRKVQAYFGWEELMYVATCNRVLFFYYDVKVQDPNLKTALLEQLNLDIKSELEKKTISDALVCLNGGNAVRHLFEVMSSMDSMVLGEREILRQVRAAYHLCKNEGLTGDHLRMAMQASVRTAKKVYTETSLGEKAVSIVSLAFRKVLAANLSKNAHFVFVGAGQTNQLFGRLLKKQGYKNVSVFNRTLTKAEALVTAINPKTEQVSEKAFPLTALHTKLPTLHYDVLIACTSATTAIVHAGLFPKENKQPKLLVDLSIPANIEQKVGDVAQHELVTVESLREIAEENKLYRKEATFEAQTIINASIKDFVGLWHQRQVERAMMPIPAGIQNAKKRATELVFDKDLAAMDEKTRAKVLEMMDYMEKKAIAAAMKTMISISKEHSKHVGPDKRAMEFEKSVLPTI